MTWLTETLRLTLFSSELLPKDHVDWWIAVTGAEPDTEQFDRKGGIRRQIGLIRDGLCSLELRLTPRRLDWLITPIISADVPLTDIPNFGAAHEAAQLLRSLLFDWIGSFEHADRIAVGAIFNERVNSIAAGYARLGTLLTGIEIAETGASDFLYQINRPRQARTGTFQLNRLSKWTVAAIEGVEIVVGSIGSAEVQQTSDRLFAVRLEVDINTAPGSAIPRGKGLVEVADELLIAGLEIAERGDVP